MQNGTVYIARNAGQVIKILMIFFVLSGFLLFLNPGIVNAIRCGDGVKEGLEECDTGPNRSDNHPDHCRTNCTLPRCGDYVTDSGEECDEGPQNSNKIPGACRTNCKRAYCGDGVLDLSENERCDDGNNDPYDGCYQCQENYLPKDNLVLNASSGPYVRLYPGRYEFIDNGQEGVIIISGAGITMDCQGATLVGLPPTMDSAVQGNTALKAQQLQKGITSKSQRTTSKRKRPSSAGQSGQGDSSRSAPSLPRSALGWQGTGIVIKSSDVVLRNCNVEGFKVGVKLKSTGSVMFDNRVCGNSKDIVVEKAGNYGVKNRCGQYEEWKENGTSGCTFGCNNLQ